MADLGCLLALLGQYASIAELLCRTCFFLSGGCKHGGMARLSWPGWLCHMKTVSQSPISVLFNSVDASRDIIAMPYFQWELLLIICRIFFLFCVTFVYFSLVVCLYIFSIVETYLLACLIDYFTSSAEYTK